MVPNQTESPAAVIATLNLHELRAGQRSDLCACTRKLEWANLSHLSQISMTLHPRPSPQSAPLLKLWSVSDLRASGVTRCFEVKPR